MPFRYIAAVLIHRRGADNANKKLCYTAQLTAGRGWFTLEKCEKWTMPILWNVDAGSFQFD